MTLVYTEKQQQSREKYRVKAPGQRDLGGQDEKESMKRSWADAHTGE